MKFVLILLSIVVALLATVHAVEKSDCALPKVVGPCRKSDFVYYYNGDAKECQEFIYGGCQGNANRFNSKAECEKICL